MQVTNDQRGMGRRQLLQASAGGLALCTASCGWLLYPERKGRSGGRIDTFVLIVDLLWLLPGIVPGAVCLAVDFTTGCIYKRGRSAARTPEGGSQPVATNAFVWVDGDAVAESADVSSDQLQLRWQSNVDVASVKSRGRLVFQGPTGARAEALVHELL